MPTLSWEILAVTNIGQICLLMQSDNRICTTTERMNRNSYLFKQDVFSLTNMIKMCNGASSCARLQSVMSFTTVANKRERMSVAHPGKFALRVPPPKPHSD